MLPRDRRRVRADRRDHRPARPRRDLDLDYPTLDLPAARLGEHRDAGRRRSAGRGARESSWSRDPNISALPEFDAAARPTRGAGAAQGRRRRLHRRDLPGRRPRRCRFRSNIPKLAEFTFTRIDDSYPARARDADDSGHVIVAGDNYGQGSSREHAAIAPRYLGLRVVIAKSFARIHWQNLANFGVLALEFDDPDDYDSIDQDDTLRIQNLNAIDKEDALQVDNASKESSFAVRHRLSPRQVKDVFRRLDPPSSTKSRSDAYRYAVWLTSRTEDAPSE